MYYLLGFLTPLYSLSVVFYLELSIYKLTPIFLFIWCYALGKSRMVDDGTKVPFSIILLIIYMSAVTLVNYVINDSNGRFEYAYFISKSETRAYYHMPVQLLQWILLLLSALFIYRCPDNAFSKYAKGLIAGLLVSVTIAFIAYILYLYNGTNLLATIGKSSFEATHGRLGGLSKEPRHLAALLVVSMLLIYFYNKLRIGRKKIPVLIIALFCVALLFTQSTSAFVGIAAIYITYLTLSKFNEKKIVAAVLVFVACIVAYKLNSELVGYQLNRISSIDKVVYYLPKDSLAIQLSITNIALFIFGAGAGGGEYHIIFPGFLEGSREFILMPEFIKAIYYRNTYESTLTPSSALIRFYSDFGAFGTLLLLNVLYRIISEINNINESNRLLIYSYIVGFISLSTISFFVYYYSICLLWSRYNK